LPPGTYTNCTITLEGRPSTLVSETLEVSPFVVFEPSIGAPLFTKAFAPDTISAGGTSTLTFTIDNSANALTAFDLSLNNTFPTGLTVATPPNATTTCNGGRVVATPGGRFAGYTANGSVAGLASCTVSFDVTSLQPGTFNNASGNLTSTLGNSGPAVDRLTVTGPEINLVGGGNSIASGSAAAVGNDTDFGALNVLAGTDTHTFTIQNTGSSPLTITSVTSDNTEFAVNAGGVGSPITAGGTGAFTVTFDPSASGPRSATITIASDDADEATYTLPMAGIGTAAAPEINLVGAGNSIPSGTAAAVANDTDFGALDIAAGTDTHTFTIQNTGSSSLAITSVTSDNTEFAVNAAGVGSPIAAGGTGTFTVTFDPSATGARSATITIASNDADEATYTLPMAGTGAASAPEINLVGAGNSIPSGTAAAVANDTDFGAIDITAGTDTHTFTIQNTGSGPLTVTSVTSDNAAEFAVDATGVGSPIAAGGSGTFTVTFDPSAAGARAATITIANDDSDEASYTLPMSGNGSTAPDIDVSSSVSGGIADGATDAQGNQAIGSPVTVTYTVSNTGSSSLTITDISTSGLNNATGATPSATLLTVAPGATDTFTVTYTPTTVGPFSFDLNITSNDPDENPYDIAVSGAGDGAAIRRRTQAIAFNFMARRADQITASDPALARRLGDRSSSDGGATIGGVGLAASGTFENARLGFSASLRQMLAAANADRNAERMALGRSLGISDTRVLAPGLNPNGIDVWTKGTWAHVDGETSGTDIGLFYAGIDYRISPLFLFGVLGQFDWSGEQDATNNFSIQGRGWMVGPYVVARLNDNAIFEGRFGWGESENDISPFNTYTDTFDTERWFAKAQVTGQFDMGGWMLLSPHVAFLHFSEKQKAYTDSNNISIPSQRIDLGRLTFGPEVSSSYKTPDGTTVSGHLGIKGIWDFAAPQLRDLDTGLAADANQGVRARVGAGATIGLSNGWNLLGDGFYDGIGADDLDAYGGSIRMTLPLN
ncbi:MAG: choice-of-anchor D domain-containing protein, partial [Pseudomonadota bacterium]